jgi:putative protein kinase ArgK-like GTPase of G3E family
MFALPEWQIPVPAVSAAQRIGIAEVWKDVECFRATLEENRRVVAPACGTGAGGPLVFGPRSATP